MALMDLIRLRQSCRKYKSIPVEKEKILKCIDAARLAPSANNAQEWKFVVVQDNVVKAQVAKAIDYMGMNKWAGNVPAFVIVVSDKQLAINAIGNAVQGKNYGQLDTGIAVENFALQATELGLGTCIIGWLNEKAIKKLLGIPNNKKVLLAISIGYRDDEQREKKRKPLDEVSSFDKY